MEGWEQAFIIIHLINTVFMVRNSLSSLSKKAFQSKANRPFADKCNGYIVNKFKQVCGGVTMWVGSKGPLGRGRGHRLIS